MLTYRIECPSCGHRLKYGDQHVGRNAKCRKCLKSLSLLSPTAAREPSEGVTVELSALTPTQVDHPGQELNRPAREEIRTSCPYCLAEYEIAKKYVGKPVRCKGCNTQFTIKIDYDAQLAELKGELVDQLQRAARSSFPRDKGMLMAEAMSTLAKIGEVAAAAAPERAESAKEEATSQAFAEAMAKVKKIQKRQEQLKAQGDWEDIEEGLDNCIAVFGVGLLLVLGVVVVALLSGTLFWGVGVIGLLMMLGGGLGAVIGFWAAVDVFLRKHPILGAFAKYAAYGLLAVVLFSIFGGTAVAIWRSCQS